MGQNWKLDEIENWTKLKIGQNWKLENIEKGEKGENSDKIKSLGQKLKIGRKNQKWTKLNIFDHFNSSFVSDIYLVRLSISVFCKPKFANVQKKEGVFGGEF